MCSDNTIIINNEEENRNQKSVKMTNDLSI